MQKHTFGLEMPRGSYCRADVKLADQYFRKNPMLAKHYTGLAGRRFCFSFDTKESRDVVAEIVQKALPKSKIYGK